MKTIAALIWGFGIFLILIAFDNRRSPFAIWLGLAGAGVSITGLGIIALYPEVL